ncbi:unnamed protein product, partial [Didymodactylos carnosus]
MYGFGLNLDMPNLISCAVPRLFIATNISISTFNVCNNGFDRARRLVN